MDGHLNHSLTGLIRRVHPVTATPDWAKPFLQENEYSPDWVWMEREIDDQTIGVAGISGTKYAYMEVHPVSIEQAKDRVVAQVKALESK
jgi:hypothetical protein